MNHHRIVLVDDRCDVMVRRFRRDQSGKRHRLRPRPYARRPNRERKTVIEVKRADADEQQVAETQQSAVHVDVQDNFAKQVKLPWLSRDSALSWAGLLCAALLQMSPLHNSPASIPESLMGPPDSKCSTPGQSRFLKSVRQINGKIPIATQVHRRHPARRNQRLIRIW